ncbi:metallophosphoesterase family protein [Ideonella livida]|uniref:DNA repair exonuclease n=1 Tax=Ideonella livida TaxID=2707176 RepID=A0A7C9TLN2_9BURK|nr:DNA repair exonuclease [Ideonella livida]NDY93660.1 DNA repair exonuclease [Ideonella livida]
MPRLLHTADWQIGRTYGQWPPEAAVPLAEARYEAVERLAALATAEAVDLVLVAGDVFDAQTLSDRSLRRLFNALEGYAGPWVLLPGNHDAALGESVWTRALRLGLVPPRVHLALRPEPLLFDALRLAVLPAPLTQRHVHQDLTAWFDQARTPAGWLRVGLAHGAVQGLLAEDLDAANPIAPDRAERADLAYLALGDWHGRRQIGPRCAYAGTPEPDRFKDNDPGHAWRVDLPEDGGVPALTSLPVGRYRWLQWRERLEVPSDVAALLQRLAALPAATVLDLRLAGHLDLAGWHQLQAGLDAAEARLRLLCRDAEDLRLLPSTEDLQTLQADGFLGELLQSLRLQQEAGGPEGATAHDALVLLATALSAPTQVALPAPGQEPA